MEKQRWESFVLEDLPERQITYNDNYLRYTRAMRQLLETGEMGEFQLADIPKQRDIYLLSWNDASNKIDWSGLFEHSIDRLFKDLERADALGDEDTGDVLRRYRGMIVASGRKSSHSRFELIDGSRGRFRNGCWIHETANKDNARDTGLGRD
ncbi:MAG: hypothetical protein KGZ50_09085 [Peptococcaceae bacterium]|nr:hypothetical protein [Peptococcaceae bacterium]